MFLLLLFLLVVGGMAAIFIWAVVWWIRHPGFSPDPNPPAISPEPQKGDSNMLPQYLIDQISKVIEEKTGMKFPKPKSIEEILANMPAQDRAKLLPTLIPLVVDTIRQSTGMSLDASLVLQEFLQGQGLGLSQLDAAIEADALRMEKFLAAVKRYQEIMAPYQDTLKDQKPLLEFMSKMMLYRLTTETFKDMPLPPDWISQQMGGLPSLPPSGPKKISKVEIVERKDDLD